MDITEKESENKIIKIVGQTNRYQIKKLTNKNEGKLKTRAEITNKNINKEYFEYNKQLELIHNIYNANTSNTDDNLIKITVQQLEKKITSYKQQDINKQKLDNNKIINLNIILNALIETKLKCYYCKCEMLILYENVRESKQWTVDRVNNDFGHNIDNFVLACLECNLNRRCKDTDKFLFTKQLNIVRQNY